MQSLKDQQQRRKAYEAAPSATKSESKTAVDPYIALLLGDTSSASAALSSSDTVASPESSARQRRPLSNGDDLLGIASSSTAQSQQQMQQWMVVAEEESNDYLRERAEAVERVESTLVEIGRMYQNLVSMISQQQDTVQQIEYSIDIAHSNVEMAQQELFNYKSTIESNRWLIIKIFAILMLFSMFFTVFVA